MSKRTKLLGVSKTPPVIFHLDDDPFELVRVEYLTKDLVEVRSFAKADDLLREVTLIPKNSLFLLDYHLGSETITGMDVAKSVRELRPDAIIFMHSNQSDPLTVIDCIKAGVDNFLEKDTKDDEFLEKLKNYYSLSLLKRGYSSPADLASKEDTQKVYVGKTFEVLRNRISMIVNSAVRSIYVFGESGVGKEMVADILEEQIPGLPFVRINCAAIAPSLMESELFGYAKGAFTGAEREKIGLLERADGGWVFLDEVGDLSLEAQASLLRLLGSKREFRRLGETESREINIRIISATNKNLYEMVEAGTFRQDLFHRLREVELIVPPLRERPDDIEPLINYFCESFDGGPYFIDTPALKILKSFKWDSGNVRELENCLRAMTEYAPGKQLSVSSIPEHFMELAKGREREIERSKKITLDATDLSEWEFIELADRLLLAIVEQVKSESSRNKVSIRRLSMATGLSRNGIMARFERMIRERKISHSEIKKLLKDSESIKGAHS